jgi:hypothetical protein
VKAGRSRWVDEYDRAIGQPSCAPARGRSASSLSWLEASSRSAAGVEVDVV